MLRVVSWNVNGLRAVAKKGFFSWLPSAGDIVGLQEVRAHLADLPADLVSMDGWHSHVVSAERKGYSGVALYSRRPSDGIETSLGVRAFDIEGRVQIAKFGALTVVNCYFPNGNGPNRDNARIPYKLRFKRRLFRTLDAAMRAGDRIVVMGDFNTAPEPIDLARPDQNKNISGFTEEERRVMRSLYRAGWVDSFRRFEPGPGHYTWWSQRFGVRERNVGWRIDHILVSPAVVPFLRAATIHADVHGSDHCPVSVDLDPDVCHRTEEHELSRRNENS